jgi:hypothetical protein
MPVKPVKPKLYVPNIQIPKLVPNRTAALALGKSLAAKGLTRATIASLGPIAWNAYFLYTTTVSAGEWLKEPLTDIWAPEVRLGEARNEVLDRQLGQFYWHKQLKQNKKDQAADNAKYDADMIVYNREKAQAIQDAVDTGVTSGVAQELAKRDTAEAEAKAKHNPYLNPALYGAGGAAAGGGLSHVYGKLSGNENLQRDLLAAIAGGAAGTAYGVYKDTAK